MNTCKLQLVVLSALCWGIAFPGVQAPNDTADAAHLREVLQIREGSTVAEIGAGAGALTIAIAEAVGPTGKVYSTDINEARLRELRNAIRQAGKSNLVVLQGDAAKTNLPQGCCDAVFMRDVYHHFGDPAAMNASLRDSLKPGGRLAIVDFPPDSGVTAPPGQRDSDKNHGITPQTLVHELEAAGFSDVQELKWSSRGYFLVFGRRAPE